jgi:DNA polymerase I
LRLRFNIAADEGQTLVACDLSNIEMVLFAAYCGDGRLLEAVKRGDDLHLLTAKMLGLRDRARPGGIYESARQQGKTYNFSRIYGGGLRTIRRSFRCSLDEARLLKKRFDEAYPETQRLQRRLDYRIQDQGYISAGLISGRRFRVDQRDSFKAVNYLVQGTAADVLKEALVKLHKDGVPVVGLVHDEVLALVDKADAEECRHLVVQRLTENEALREKVPLRADGDIVQHWSDAKPLKDEKGTYLFTPEWAGGERRYLEAA